jgi:elongation factor P hydroxylase
VNDEWRNESGKMELRTFTDLLNTHYLPTFNTILVGGHEEPFYEAAKSCQPARIGFTRDYIRSAMHELAHWCIAGKKRRLQDDFGYWYAPDGRTQVQQELFYSVEVRPQAIEWAFATACGVPFEVSMDNLNSAVEGSASFEQQVRTQVAHYVERGFPKRAGEIVALLSEDSHHEPEPRSITSSRSHA